MAAKKMKTNGATSKTKPKAVDRTERLLRKARALGVKSLVVLPFDEIRLGVQLSERPRAVVLPKLLTLAEDGNMHARRIAFAALQRMEAWDDPHVLDLFVRGLDDPEGWVRYDAAWALGESRTTDPRAIAGLRKLGQKKRSTAQVSEGAAEAVARARESLAELER
jgi:HEAT repeat protein